MHALVLESTDFILFISSYYVYVGFYFVRHLLRLPIPKRKPKWRWRRGEEKTSGGGGGDATNSPLIVKIVLACPSVS